MKNEFYECWIGNACLGSWSARSKRSVQILHVREKEEKSSSSLLSLLISSSFALSKLGGVFVAFGALSSFFMANRIAVFEFFLV